LTSPQLIARSQSRCKPNGSLSKSIVLATLYRKGEMI
jgi:hypothetical protein